jgi:hypothetical protein
VFGLMRKAEVAAAFRLTARSRAVPKSELMVALATTFVECRTFAAWCPEANEVVYRVCVLDLCERLRLMFFGNFDQDWSEFVLADLGIFNYEKVTVPASARAFQRREHIDDFHAIYRCRERFHREESSAAILAAVPPPIRDNAWLESRRAKLLFRLGQRYEKEGDLDGALAVYTDCAYPGARVRAVRVLERQELWENAAALAMRAQESPEDEVERQQVARIIPRLRRRLGLADCARQRPSGWLTFELNVPATDDDLPVELATSAFLTEPDAPVHYVENALINSLFGLLCWDVVFLPLPGAFFHEFHSAPADLYTPDFHRRREREFAACFAQLASGEYQQTIRRNFVRKMGIQSAFVSWGWVTEELLDVALECLPAAHLEHCFHRILRDVKTNRAGFPDLIQFWPRERRYRMIEVKGPGDRLQDNQIRWLEYCASHGMPVSVCHVRWAETAAQ